MAGFAQKRRKILVELQHLEVFLRREKVCVYSRYFVPAQAGFSTFYVYFKLPVYRRKSMCQPRETAVVL